MIRTPTITERIEDDFYRTAARKTRPRGDDEAEIRKYLARGGTVVRLPSDPALTVEHQWSSPPPSTRAPGAQ